MDTSVFGVQWLISEQIIWDRSPIYTLFIYEPLTGDVDCAREYVSDEPTEMRTLKMTLAMSSTQERHNSPKSLKDATTEKNGEKHQSISPKILKNIKNDS